MSADPELTVVIATRNRADALAALLDGLTRQVDPPAFEVVVADNGSRDRTPEVIAEARARLPLRGVLVQTPGKGRALNEALREAKGKLVVFTDDDVEPDPRWLAELHAGAARHPEAGVFGGLIEVDRSAVPGWIRRSHNLMGLLTSEHLGPSNSYTYEFGRYPFGPNMAVRRHRLAGMESPYPVTMGPGTDLPVGDESAFLLRVSPPEARDRVFLPEARVLHVVERENVTLAEAIRRSYFQGRAQRRVRIAMVAPESGTRTSWVRLVLWRVGACRSLRELLCVVARQAGYLREG